MKSHRKNLQGFIRPYQAVLIAYEEDHKRFFEYPLMGGKNDSFKIRIFSDSILIGCPITGKGKHNLIEGLEEFYELLNTISILQLDMANQGYLIRGGIAVDSFIWMTSSFMVTASY